MITIFLVLADLKAFVTSIWTDPLIFSKGLRNERCASASSLVLSEAGQLGHVEIQAVHRSKL